MRLQLSIHLREIHVTEPRHQSKCNMQMSTDEHSTKLKAAQPRAAQRLTLRGDRQPMASQGLILQES